MTASATGSRRTRWSRAGERGGASGATCLLIAIISGACGGAGGGPGERAQWHHVTETVDGVTTVKTLSGSVWGDITLQEELSIGMLEGPEEFTFAMVTGVWPLADKVIVSDGQLPAVRAYDLDGNYLFSIGRPGQGPGEYESAGGLAALPDGRIAVFDGSKLLIYAADGSYLEQWAPREGGGMRFMAPGMLAATTDGRVWVRRPVIPEGGMRMGALRWGMRALGPDGEGDFLEVPTFDYEAPTISVTVGQGRAMMRIPFAPDVESALLPGGGFVAGLSAEYRFQISDPNGAVRVVVEKDWEPVPVTADEIRLQQSQMRVIVNGERPAIDWSEAPVPETKPAYDGFLAGRDGRILVLRAGSASVEPACLEPGVSQDDLQAMDCVEGLVWADLFEPDGTLLGTFEVPQGANLAFGGYLDGETLWTSVQDEMGTVTVKRYRLVTPDETRP